MIVCFVCAFVIYTGKKVKPQFSRYIPIFCTDLLMANWITACRGSTLDGPKLIQWVFLGFFVRTNCDKEYYKNRQLQCCNVSNLIQSLKEFNQKVSKDSPYIQCNDVFSCVVLKW